MPSMPLVPGVHVLKQAYETALVKLYHAKRTARLRIICRTMIVCDILFAARRGFSLGIFSVMLAFSAFVSGSGSNKIKVAPFEGLQDTVS